MALFKVEISRSAQKEIRKIQPPHRKRVVSAILKLVKEPRPAECQKIRTFDNSYRIRVGDYRVVYIVHDDEKVLTIIKVGHRRDVYRNIS
ncbi:MAG: type II toxin-antitoxin system RelE/ParE family toxin [Candidatus Spechtbacterales bacterium]